jgi:hypothetical protein
MTSEIIGDASRAINHCAAVITSGNRFGKCENRKPVRLHYLAWVIIGPRAAARMRQSADFQTAAGNMPFGGIHAAVTFTIGGGECTGSINAHTDQNGHGDMNRFSHGRAI